MRISRALIALLLCGAAAHAQELQPLIVRPLTLPRGTLDLTLHGTYTNWGTGNTAGGGPSSLDGETLALGTDLGVTDQVQLGLGTALPINPGAGFGSILASAALAVDRGFALRADAGFENFGLNGDNTGHVNNIGVSGTGIYVGASLLTEASSDFLVFSSGNNNSGTNIGINLPAGLLLQPDPHLAVTLQAGYSSAIAIPSSGSQSIALHFIPVGLEAVLTPMPRLDIGARFFLDGYVAQSGGNSSGNPGYFDLRALMLWIRIHA